MDDLSFLSVEFQASLFTLFFHFHQKGSLVPLHFLPLEWGTICISEFVDIFPGNLDSSL